MHAAVGAVGGAILAAAPGMGLPATMLLGGGESTVEGMAHRLIDSNGQSVGTLQQGASDFVVGAMSAGTAHLATQAVAPLARATVTEAAEGAERKAAGFCFAAGTPVATADGLRPIETIALGELLWSRDPVTGELALRPVTEVFVTPDAELMELVVVGGAHGVTEHLRVTPGHRFWVRDRGWVPVEALHAGDEFQGLNAPPLTVSQVSPLPGRETVYNFAVDEFHTYFVGQAGAWTHNEGCAAKKPAAYNRKAHYGRSPTKADRVALGAGPDQVVDHNPPLVKRYYAGDPAIGEKPGIDMNDEERRASANDRSRMQLQPKSESNAQGAEMSRYSRGQKKERGL